MKMIWFYVLEEKVQPYCAVELMTENMNQLFAERCSEQQNVYFYQSKRGQKERMFRGDVAVGCDQGLVKIFDFSNHF